MIAVEIVECADDVALGNAVAAASGWLIGLTRQADGTLEDALVVRGRGHATSFTAVVPVADVERFAAALPSEVAGALREAAARIRKGGSQ